MRGAEEFYVFNWSEDAWGARSRRTPQAHGRVFHDSCHHVRVRVLFAVKLSGHDKASLLGECLCEWFDPGHLVWQRLPALVRQVGARTSYLTRTCFLSVSIFLMLCCFLLEVRFCISTEESLPEVFFELRFFMMKTQIVHVVSDLGPLHKHVTNSVSSFFLKMKIISKLGQRISWERNVSDPQIPQVLGP